jgi:hypothetical protein
MEIAPLSIAASARLNGQHAWMARRLFELMGTSVAVTTDLQAKLMLGQHCYHYAWHAELFERLLPTPAAVHPYAVVEPPAGGTVAMFNAVAGTTSNIERLVGIYRVAMAQYHQQIRDHLTRCNAVSDAPTMRVLNHVLLDVHPDTDDAKSFFVTFLSSSADQDLAATCQRHLENLANPLSGG